MTGCWILILVKIFNLTNTLLLGLEGIGQGILKILACLLFDSLLVVVLLVGVLLNCKNIYYLKDLLFLLAINLSQLDH